MTFIAAGYVSVGLRTGAFPGCQVLVARNGNVVIDKSYGYTDNTKTHRVNDSTIYDLVVRRIPVSVCYSHML